MHALSVRPRPAPRRNALRHPRRGRSRWASLAVAVVGLADLAFAAVLATGLAARSIRPDVWGVPQASALALPAAAALSVPITALWVALTLASPRRRRSVAWWTGCLVHVGLTAAALSRLDVPRAAPVADASDPTLTFLSLNGGAPSEASPAWFARLLAADAPEVVALQETSLLWLRTSPPGAPVERVLANQPMAGPLLGTGAYTLPIPDFVDTFENGERAAVDVPVFVRDSAGIHLSDYAAQSLGAPDDEVAGEVSRSEVVWRGHRIAVYNVHLRSFGEERPWRTGQLRSAAAWRVAAQSFQRSLSLRAAEAERFRAMLDHETLPFLVAGDFNSTPDQWAYAHIAAGLSDGLSRHGTWWARATYPSRFPLVRIDAVLASPHWRLDDAWVGPDGLSDHRPVLARLRLRAAPDSSAAVMLPASAAPRPASP